MNAFNNHSCENTVFNVPERLVLEGYRHWVVGFATAQRPDLASMNSLYSDYLPAPLVHPALTALTDFINALGICSTCPLKTFQVGSSHLCRDEAMVLALVAGLQHGDDDAVDLSLTSLSCKDRCTEVALAAEDLAQILKHADHILLPIPVAAIRNILMISHASREARDAISIAASRTLH
jgi:hypothetical protein